MDNKEKVERLETEIKELEEKKLEKDKINDLFSKRNKLKYTKLYAAGDLMSKMGKGVAKWADKKNEQLEQEEKEGKPTKKEDPVDMYEELFGDSDLSKQFGGI